MCSMIDLRDGCEHLWQADPTYWGRHAPILFPTVGESKDGAITVNGEAFPMGRHGFARFRNFTLVSRDETSARLRLVSDAETRACYPFDFVFETEYRVAGGTITQLFRVKNTGNGPMAFQLGGHPAFAVPCGSSGGHADHSIVLSDKGNHDRHLLTEGGLYSGETRPFLKDTDRFELSHDLFREDAIVFRNDGITDAALLNNTTGKQVRMRFEGFPHLGIWSVPGAGYVCIEPWIGCADDAHGTNDIFLKDSAVILEAGEEFNTSFTISVVQP
ncbi:MAG: aldose 1-epimerase family protein [Flavobacteriales bacterium]|nr:aldose 1-epimerase family protein [Flavobacteriales bacterium]